MNNKKENLKTLSKSQIDSVMSLYSKGLIDKAIFEIKALNEIYPNVPLLFNILGACYKSKGDIDAAAKMFKTAITIKPDYAEAYFNLAVVTRGLGDLNSAIESYNKAISISPNYPDAYNNLGNCFKELGKFDEAIESYEWAIAYKHNFFHAYNNLGLTHVENGNPNDAIKSYEATIKIKPDFLDAHFNLGILLKELGKKEKSISCFQNAIEINPTNPEAHRNLSMLKQFKKNDPHILQMKSILSEKNLDSSAGISLSFALSKAYEDLGDKNSQFKFLNNGSKLKKELLNYSIDKDKNKFGVLKKLFKKVPSALNSYSYEPSKVRPIFILGMPRSGTSLVEQIIASHHAVHGAGELRYFSSHVSPVINKILKRSNSLISKKDLLTIRTNYLDSLANLKVDESIITDKMPDNFNYIGFILSAFPDAKIIHLRRDARATCWSIYKYLFDTDGNGFSFNQQDLAVYYGLYSDLMTFWHKQYPDKIYDICYEDLTTNQEEETRKLLEYCNLEWDENCLNFHKNNRAVKTVSALQVRKKMYQGSSDAWKKYEKYLQPLIKGLNNY
jgi:tetratricopeptide (TPR) repeat protein